MKKVWRKVLAVFGSLFFLLFAVTNAKAAVTISSNSSSIGNTVIMTAESSDATVNGTALLNTLAALDSNSSNRYVIRLGPGTYDVGTTNLVMKDFVDIEGSGENVSVITGHPDGPATVTAFGISAAELRFLTVQNTGGGSVAVAIGNGGGLKITHVYADASGSPINHAIENHCPSPPCPLVMMQNVFANVYYTGGSENTGILNDANSSVAMSDTIVNVGSDEGTGTNTNTGIQNNSTAPVIMEAYVMVNGGATTYGMVNDNTGGQMFNVYTFATNATGSNIGILNRNSSVPIMRNIRTEGSGGTESTGLSNLNCGTAATTMTNIVAHGHNATASNIGILNNGCSHVFNASLANATPGKSGALHYGIKNVDSSPKIESLLITAPGNDGICGNGCYGVHNTSTGSACTVKIDNSQISTAPTSSSSATINNGKDVTTYVGNSKLDGNAVQTTGTLLKCIGSYNATYDQLSNTCLAP